MPAGRDIGTLAQVCATTPRRLPASPLEAERNSFADGSGNKIVTGRDDALPGEGIEALNGPVRRKRLKLFYSCGVQW